MKCSMRIIRKLPPAPRPTRDYHNPALEDDLVTIRKYSPVPTFADDNVKEHIKDYARKRKEKSKKKQQKVIEMAKRGQSTEDISAETGYCTDVVNRIIRKMRKEGTLNC